MEDSLTTQLSEIEKAEFETLEAVIKREMGSFIAVGKALRAIRDGQLYREQFRSFDAYCNEQWGMGRNFAYKQIAGAKVAVNLCTDRTHLCAPCETQPTSEYQIRPLVLLEPEQQRTIWEKAVKTFDRPGQVPTYEHVKATVKELIGPAPLPPKPKEHPRFTNAVHIVLTAIAHLEGILDDDHRREEAFLMLLEWIDKNRKRRVR